MGEYNELYHHGVKGQKWGVRRTPEQLGHKSTTPAMSNRPGAPGITEFYQAVEANDPSRFYSDDALYSSIGQRNLENVRDKDLLDSIGFEMMEFRYPGLNGGKIPWAEQTMFFDKEYATFSSNPESYRQNLLKHGVDMDFKNKYY